MEVKKVMDVVRIRKAVKVISVVCICHVSGAIPMSKGHGGNYS
jgi:hypothetical protein